MFSWAECETLVEACLAIGPVLVQRRNGVGSASPVCWARCELLLNKHEVLALVVLIWCWTGVVGGGLALNRHRACLLGDQMTKNIYIYFETFILSFLLLFIRFSFIICNQFITN